MGARSSILLAATFVVAWTARLAAQDSIPPGTRVRLTMKVPRVSPLVLDTHRVVVKGRVLAVDGGALLVAREPPRDTLSVPLATIVRLERQVGESHEVRGALIGGALGATLGLAIIADETKKGGVCRPGPLQCFPILAALFTVTGGAGWGARLGRARWRRVPVSAIRAAFSSNGLPTATFTLRFRF